MRFIVEISEIIWNNSISGSSFAFSEKPNCARVGKLIIIIYYKGVQMVVKMKIALGHYFRLMLLNLDYFKIDVKSM